MSSEDESQKIKDFFKRSVTFKQIEDILGFNTDTLFGIDPISAKELKSQKIRTIQDLANLNLEALPEIKGIMPQVLLKWIKIAKLLEKVVREKLKKRKKILLIGLGNSGKTSILAVLQEKFSLIKDLLPTKGVKREVLDLFGYNLVSWDMGGQVQYRENYYFKKPELFFADVDIILYVIDIQDPERYNESAEYFEHVIEALKELKESPPILIVFHKSDQDMRKTLQWQKNVDVAKKIFDPVISKYKDFESDYFTTTIFQRETVMQMFSSALMKVSETSEIISNILEGFGEEIKGRALSLISMDGLIFGSYKKSKNDESLVNNTALLLQTLSNFHSSIGLTREKSLALELPLNKITIRGEKLFEYSDLNIPVYLWLLSEHPEKLDERLDFFKDELLPLINFFI